MGHVLNYTMGDVVTHFRRRNGWSGCCARWATTRSACPPRTRRSRRAGTRARSRAQHRRTSARQMKPPGLGDRLGPRDRRARARTSTAGRSGCSCASSSAAWPTARRRRSTGARTTRRCVANEYVVDGQLRALRRRGRGAQPRAVVLQDHRLRRRAARATCRAAATGPSARRRSSATGSAAPRAPRSSSASTSSTSTSRSSRRGRTRCSARPSSCWRPSTRSSSGIGRTTR